MTVKELIELNDFIGDIKIQVRKDGNSLLLKSLKIGPDAQLSGDLELQKREIVKNTEINIRDTGDYRYGLMLRKIPKEWLNLKVGSWRVWGAYRREMLHNSLEFIEITCFPDGYREQKEKPDTIKADGQLSLFKN